MSIKTALERLFNRSVHPAHQPYRPAPPTPDTVSQHQIPNDIPNNASYIEVQSDQQTIGDIKFGTEKVIIVDTRGCSRDMSRQSSHVLGSGKLVSKIEDIAGVCRICQSIAMEKYQAGEINLQQAQVLSLYDKGSAAVCNVCGIQGCIQHIRPIQTDQGILSICPICQQKLDKKLNRQRFLRLLLSPFTEPQK